MQFLPLSLFFALIRFQSFLHFYLNTLYTLQSFLRVAWIQEMRVDCALHQYIESDDVFLGETACPPHDYRLVPPQLPLRCLIDLDLLAERGGERGPAVHYVCPDARPPTRGLRAHTALAQHDTLDPDNKFARGQKPRG